MEFFKKDKNNYFVIHLIYWFFAIPTVKHNQREVKLVGPVNYVYPILFIAFVIATRIERMLEDTSFLTDAGNIVSQTVYQALKSIEALAACMAIVTESILYKKIKLQFYKNLFHMDNQMGTQNQYENFPRTSFYVFIGYSVYTIYVNIFDSFVWKNGIHAQFLMMKYIIIDLTMLQFCQELRLCQLRLQTMNALFARFGRKNNDAHGKKHLDFQTTSMLCGDALNDSMDYHRDDNVDFIISIYKKIIDNVLIIQKRMSIHIFMACVMSILTTMTTANILAHPHKFSSYAEPQQFISLIIWQFRYTLQLTYCTYSSEAIVEQAIVTLKLLGKTYTSKIIDPLTRFRLKKFKVLIPRSDLCISVWNLFPVNFTLVYTIVGLTTSYSIILIQMA